MRRNIVFTALLTLAVAPFASAKMPWVKKAKDAGIATVKDCKSCHAEKNTKDSLNDAGKWLVTQKAAKKATEIDPLWMKDYKAK